MNSLDALALDAFIGAYPLHDMGRMRAATSPRSLPGIGFAGSNDSSERWCNAFTQNRQLLDAGGSRVVTPNNDTPYINAWLDLGAGPLVIDAPDTAGRYDVLGLLGFYTNPFAHLGSRLNGTQAQSFIVVGPDWHYLLPGLQRVDIQLHRPAPPPRRSPCATPSPWPPCLRPRAAAWRCTPPHKPPTTTQTNR